MKTTRSTPRAVRPRAAGFSLIEVMVAMVVFAIGILSLAVMVPMGTNRIGKAGKQTHASTLAAMRAEDLLITRYGDADLTAGVHTDTHNPVDGVYYVQWSVTEDSPITSCKKVVVTVSRGSTSGTPEAAVTIVCPAAGG
jgi:type IV pilus assembly protein PilV